MERKYNGREKQVNVRKGKWHGEKGEEGVALIAEDGVRKKRKGGEKTENKRDGE